MNGLTFLALIVLLLVAAGITYSLYASRHPLQPGPDPINDPDVIAHDFHEESQP